MSYRISYRDCKSCPPRADEKRAKKILLVSNIENPRGVIYIPDTDTNIAGKQSGLFILISAAYLPIGQTVLLSREASQLDVRPLTIIIMKDITIVSP